MLREPLRRSALSSAQPSTGLVSSVRLLLDPHQTTASGLEPLLNIEELAEYLDVPVATI